MLAGCAATELKPVQPKTLTARDIGWVTSLVDRPVNDLDRQCLRSGLQTAFALLLFKEGGYDDKSIEDALLNNLPNDRVRGLRKAAAAEWLRTHEPAAAANVYLDRCLFEQGSDLPETDRWLRCFLSTEPAAMFSLYRQTGRSLTEAVQAVTPFYPISADPGRIAELGHQVFALTGEADDVNLREQIFVQCLGK